LSNKVSISKIARDMEISVSTVSRALSGNGRISEETRQRVLEYLEGRQLVPNRREKRYGDVKTNIIGVTIPREDELVFLPYFQHIFFSICDYFAELGMQVIPIKISSKDITYLKRAIEGHIVDGVILSRRVETMGEIRFLKERGVPFVLIGSIDDPDVRQVEADNEKAVYELISTLIQKECYKMAVMCADKRHPINQKRFKGIMDAHVEHYMVLDPEFVFYGTDSMTAASNAIDRILAAKMDGIICMDDNICLNVMKLLQKRHVKIPRDIKVASLHNSSMIENWKPRITCVNYDMDALGRTAGEMLYRLLCGEDSPPTVIVKSEIQLKESTE